MNIKMNQEKFIVALSTACDAKKNGNASEMFATILGLYLVYLVEKIQYGL